MTTTPDEDSTSRVVAFRDARWKTQWLVIGLVVLLLIRSLGFIDREWLTQFPFWLVILVTAVLPQLFLLFFPLLTREPRRRESFGIPAFSRWLTEFGLAIPVVFGTLFILGAVNVLIGYLFPGTSLTPDEVSNLAHAPNKGAVIGMLVVAFTFVPVCEELFFRGFLHNAFRARMPLFVAGGLQSLIFGIVHFYGAMHIAVVVVLGLVMTAVYEWRKTLIAPILVHAGVNFMAAVSTVAMMFVIASSPVIGVSGNPEDTQCIIREFGPNSAAEDAGLQVGDIIKSFDNRPIRDMPHLARTVREYRVGDSVPVTIDRSGTELEFTVVLRKREND